MIKTEYRGEERSRSSRVERREKRGVGVVE
jgi:hypothetical protein